MGGTKTMTEKETKNKLEELKDRKIDEETLDEIAGGGTVEIAKQSNSRGDAKKANGGLKKKVVIR
jgi:hypothetical protein